MGKGSLQEDLALIPKYKPMSVRPLQAANSTGPGNLSEIKTRFQPFELVVLNFRSYTLALGPPLAIFQVLPWSEKPVYVVEPGSSPDA
jgi:hypothetical protein